jgi:hypothetical protein
MNLRLFVFKLKNPLLTSKVLPLFDGRIFGPKPVGYLSPFRSAPVQAGGQDPVQNRFRSQEGQMGNIIELIGTLLGPAGLSKIIITCVNVVK